MKKIIISLLVLLVLCGCSKNNAQKANEEKYLDYCDLLMTHEEFKDRSEFFDVTSDITSTEEGYRYYIIIDNPKIAMYNIEAIALEKEVDYTKNMAASIGIFEENKYTFIPNQANPDDGFVKGVSISGLTTNPSPTLYLLVEWNDVGLNITKREFIKVNISNGENYE